MFSEMRENAVANRERWARLWKRYYSIKRRAGNRLVACNERNVCKSDELLMSRPAANLILLIIRYVASAYKP